MITCQVIKYYSCFHNAYIVDKDGKPTGTYQCSLYDEDHKTGNCSFIMYPFDDFEQCTNEDAIEYAEKKFAEKK